MNKKTVVIGASPKKSRFSNKAVRMLSEYGHPLVAIGLREAEIYGIKIIKDPPEIENVHTITIYVGKKNQKEYYDYILNLKPKRIIFNPGAENQELEKMAKNEGIEVVQDCTLVMLSKGKF